MNEDRTELERRLQELQTDNVKQIEELARYRVKFAPQTAQQLLFEELLNAVFPPDSDERLRVFIRMEERIGMLLKEAKSEAVKRDLTAGVRLT